MRDGYESGRFCAKRAAVSMLVATVALAVSMFLPGGDEAWAQGESLEAQTIIDPDNEPWSGAGPIVDPENPATPAPIPASSPLPEARSFGGPPVLFRGRFASNAAVDTRHDDALEDTVLVSNELELRARVRVTDRWSAVMEGRLGWWMTGSGPAEAPTYGPSAGAWQGRLEPELRDFYISGRAGRFLFRFGQQSIVWGSSDISKPADVINPVDYRRGLFSSPGDARIPVPAIDVVHVWDRVSWEWLLVPFFVPHRVAVFGSDAAVLSPAALAGAGIPVPLGRSLDIIDPSLEDLVQPLLLQTELPEEIPRNVSVGSRLTFRPRGWDISLGWFFGWDRFPRVAVDPLLGALAEALASAGPGGALRDPATVSAAQAILERILEGEELYSATYERRHVVEVDGVNYFGPVGLRFESALSPERTLYLDDFSSVRRASLFSAVGLSFERSDRGVVVSGEVFYQRVFARGGDGGYALGTESLVGLAGGLELGFGAFERLGGVVEDMSLTLAMFYLPDGRDLIVSPRVSWAVTPRLELSTGATLVESFGSAQTVGDFVDRDDAFFVGLERTF